MSDLIDREALLRQIDIDSEGEPGYYGDTWKFIDTIKSMPPAELSTNLASLGTDLISRQAAISAICNACGKIDCDKMDKCEKLQLPPANCSEFPNNSDTISRQAAIDALGEEPPVWYDGEDEIAEQNQWKRDIEAIKQLPPIQPEPHWIPVTEDIPDEERECWITPKTTSKVYRGVFTRHYGECHRTGFICDDGFMWLNTALAWMYCEVPEPYKGVTE